MDYQKLLKNKLDRRRLLGGIGVMGAGAVLAACDTSDPIVDTPPVVDQPDTPPEAPNLDAAILNFALNLEYLEAAFYLAAVGRLSELDGVGGDADIILPEGFDGSTSITFDSDEIASYADEIATDELNHVNFLRTALGDAAADRPVLDLGPAFAAAAAAAFGLDAETAAAFNPFASELLFLHGAFIFEDVGVTAYNGAAPAITDAAGVLAPAAGILAVEAYHAGQIRTLLYNRREEPTPFGIPVVDVVQGISDLRAELGGGSDQGIVLDGAANINPTNENSVAFARTPRQVANIVFFAPDVTMGGFYPEGLAFPEDLMDDLGTLLSL